MRVIESFIKSFQSIKSITLDFMHVLNNSMSPTGFKDIVWFLVAPAFIVVIFTFGVSINSIWALTSLILTIFVIARKFLVKKAWYQKASIVLAAFYGVGTLCTLIFQRHSDADIQALSLAFFEVFLLRTSTPNMSKTYQMIVRVSVFSIIIFLGLILIFPFESDDYLFPSPIFAVFAVFSAIFLLLLAFLKNENEQKEIIDNIQKQESTINWFSTLVNLVSHNLRSPLANILGNAQILEVKYPSTDEQGEVFQIVNSVRMADQIINRLLKASFVTDNMSKMTISESLLQAYPNLILKGEFKDLTYQESVSFLLSLEVFLDNSFRFSPDRVEVLLGENQIEILDFGPGLNQDQLDRFGNVDGNTLGTLHGIGIPFALRILKTIGYVAKAENCNPGFKITVFKISNDTPHEIS